MPLIRFLEPPEHLLPVVKAGIDGSDLSRSIFGRVLLLQLLENGLSVTAPAGEGVNVSGARPTIVTAWIDGSAVSKSRRRTGASR
jgi:hypothetical protein